MLLGVTISLFLTIILCRICTPTLHVLLPHDTRIWLIILCEGNMGFLLISSVGINHKWWIMTYDDSWGIDTECMKCLKAWMFMIFETVMYVRYYRSFRVYCISINFKLHVLRRNLSDMYKDNTVPKCQFAQMWDYNH